MRELEILAVATLAFGVAHFLKYLARKHDDANRGARSRRGRRRAAP